MKFAISKSTTEDMQHLKTNFKKHMITKWEEVKKSNLELSKLPNGTCKRNTMLRRWKKKSDMFK
jgi:hypothetical protein